MTIYTALKSVYKLLTTIGLVVALTACGGGGGSSSNPPAPDSTPDAFIVSAVTNAAPNAEVTSAAVTVSGINQATAISVTGGTYSIAGGAYSDAAGTVTNGQAVTVKVTTSTQTNTAVTATLTIGGVAGQFKVTTAPDVTPDAFTFTAVKDVTPNSVNTSSAITLAGVDVAVPISITAGEYSINSGTFTSAAGTVSNGQTVTVRATASNQLSTDVTAALTIGGVPGTFKITTFADTVAPTAEILFPPPVSMTEGNSILVRGSASDDYSSVVSVKVNGVIATTTDGFKNWQALVPLADTTAPLTTATSNTVTVVAEDSAGNRSDSAAQIAIKQAPLNNSFPDSLNRFRYVWGMAVDRLDGRNRLLVTDESSKIYSVDLATGARTVFATTTACATLGIVINSGSKHLYATCDDSINARIIDFDLADSSQYQTYTSPLYKSIFSVVTDIDNNTLKIVTVNDGDGAVVTTDQPYLNFNVFSDTSKNIPNINNPINHSWGMALDKTHNRYLVTDYSQQTIFAVDATTGIRSVFSNNTTGTGDFFGAIGDTNISGIVVDEPNQRALVTEVISGNIYSVDLATGNRSLLSSVTLSNPYNRITESYGVAVVNSNGYAFFSDQPRKAIFAVDLVTGHRVIFSKN